MDVAAILDLIVKGLGVATALIEAGASAAPAIKTLVAIAQGAQAGHISADDLAAHEADLDALIADFNAPLA